MQDLCDFLRKLSVFYSMKFSGQILFLDTEFMPRYFWYEDKIMRK